MLDKLEKLLETNRLSLQDNSLVKPPQAICDQGVRSLYGYLKVRIVNAKIVAFKALRQWLVKKMSWSSKKGYTSHNWQ